MENFGSVLDWLISADGGAYIVVAWALSWGLEEWSKWNALTSKARALIILGAAILLGVVATWVKAQPELVEAVTPYANTIVYVISAWLALQVAHKVDPNRTENKTS